MGWGCGRVERGVRGCGVGVWEGGEGVCVCVCVCTMNIHSLSSEGGGEWCCLGEGTVGRE